MEKSEKNKDNIDPKILSAADFLAIGEELNDDDNSVMIDGKLIRDHNISNTLNQEKDNFNPDDYLDKKAFKRMGWGLWLSENRKKIIKAFVVLLIMISSFFFIYSVYNLIIYFGSPDPEEIPNNLVISNSRNTVDLRFSSISYFAGTSSDDLAVIIENPNEKYYAKFDYCFMQADEVLKCDQSFVYPGEEKYIFALGIEPLDNTTDLNIELSNVSFTRLNNKRIPDLDAYKNERLNFVISDLVFSAAASGISNVIDLNSLSFNILNDTSYGYYEVPLNILIFKNNVLNGVNHYVINGFDSGANKDINMSWPGNLRGSTNVEIVYDINILDEDIFDPYSIE